MKTKSILLILFAISIVFTSCSKKNEFIKPSGNVITKTMSVDDINKLDIEGPYNVSVSLTSDEEGVIIEADDNLHQYIERLQIEDRLVVKFTQNITVDYETATLNLIISMKSLINIYGAGAINLIVNDEINTDHFHLELSGASNFQGKVNSNSFSAILTGASDINIIGSTGEFEVIVEGACEMYGFDFATNTLDADLEGASRINLTVNNSMDVKASGASSVYYKGDAIINSQKLSGDSKIVKVG
ncbi:MAG: hypothetical protein C0598_14675 [Marinilabiliales bacterium]|nr:MAG: hypothetical protein C0598_14675 [Marinilabiliales bacterium]